MRRVRPPEAKIRCVPDPENLGSDRTRLDLPALTLPKVLLPKGQVRHGHEEKFSLRSRTAQHAYGVAR